MVWRNISLSDVVRVPHFNGENLDTILYELGMDVEKGYDSCLCTHRALDNSVVTCTLYMGKERFDRGWLTNNPLSSIEAVYASTNDRSLREELSGMNRRAGYMRKWEKEE